MFCVEVIVAACAALLLARLLAILSAVAISPIICRKRLQAALGCGNDVTFVDPKMKNCRTAYDSQDWLRTCLIARMAFHGSVTVAVPG